MIEQSENACWSFYYDAKRVSMMRPMSYGKQTGQVIDISFNDKETSFGKVNQ